MTLLARGRAEWRLKLALTAVLNLVFWTGYSWLGRHTFFPVRTPPLTWLDRAIDYQPVFWGWVYLSQFLFTGTLPWLIDSRDKLRRYVVGLALMVGVSFACFIFFPVHSPRPGGADASGAMAVILAYDGRYNAFPSLHAGFLAYMACVLGRMLGRRISVFGWFVAAIWGGAILYSTLATRQHYALDLVAGGLVGLLASWVAWRGTSHASAAAATARSSPVASQAGCK